MQDTLLLSGRPVPVSLRNQWEGDTGSLSPRRTKQRSNGGRHSFIRGVFSRKYHAFAPTIQCLGLREMENRGWVCLRDGHIDERAAAKDAVTAATHDGRAQVGRCAGP